MWRTFGGGSGGASGGGGGGMGGGGAGFGGGGRMLRTFHRGIKPGGGSGPTGNNGSGGGGGGNYSNSATTTTNNSTTTSAKPNQNKPNPLLTLSSSSPAPSPFSLLNVPACVAATAPYWAPCTCFNCNGEFEWECVGGVEDDDDKRKGYFGNSVFGLVPSVQEVEQAVSSLQQVIDPTSFSQYIRDKNIYNSDNDEIDMISSPTGSQKAGSELDWMEPSLQGYVSRTFHSPGPARVYDAFHLLQADPSVKRMVVSLSSDKAVWKAVMDNEVVRELRDSLSKADKSVSGSSEKALEGSNAATDILSWIFVNTKAKVMELVDKITNLVNELFQSPPVEDNATASGKEEAEEDKFQKTVKSSLMLSVLVLLIVVVGRLRTA